MSTIAMTNRLEMDSFASRTLKVSVRLFFGVLVLGQVLFAFTVASYYGSVLLRGNLLGLNQFMAHGYVPGDGPGNLAVAVHLGSAVIIILAGALQLIPQLRNRFPAFHRWNGRVYIVSAFSISLAGLYMMWMRGTVGDFAQHVGTSLMAVLILVFAILALRSAMARDFKAHRRWALRLYFVVSASLFIRAGLFLWLLLNQGAVGFDPTTFQGPFLTFISYAQYLLPLAVLEIYMRVQERPNAARRFGMALGLCVLTVGLAGGIFGVSMAIWVPHVKAAFDGRKSIAETLAATIAANGMDAAVKQYHELKANAPTEYNFDESQLNVLGYNLIRSKHFKEAIRIFQLNIEAYPQSGNVYDSLGEAYMNDDNKPLAIANYQKSLEVNPKNRNAVEMLRKIGAR